MGGDHGHEHGLPKVPDYSIYKWQDCPELVRLHDNLAQKGLKDPWIRNEVWRYQVDKRGKYQRLYAGMTRGMKWGFIAFLGTVAVETALGIDWKDLRGKHKHGHGAHH